MKEYFSYDVLVQLLFSFVIAVVMAAIPVSIIGYFYDYSFMDVVKTSAMVVVGFYAVFIVGMGLIFFLTARR